MLTLYPDSWCMCMSRPSLPLQNPILTPKPIGNDISLLRSPHLSFIANVSPPPAPSPKLNVNRLCIRKNSRECHPTYHLALNVYFILRNSCCQPFDSDSPSFLRRPAMHFKSYRYSSDFRLSWYSEALFLKLYCFLLHLLSFAQANYFRPDVPSAAL